MSPESNSVWFVSEWPRETFACRIATADNDAPTLTGVMAPLLVYADDLILMSEHASGLQRQLDALASFCEQRQLTVNLSKTKVVLETCQSDVCDFVLSGAVGEQVESHRCLNLGFVVHATKKLTSETGFLVATANQALFVMRQRCTLLGIRDLALQCKVFDTLLFPTLSDSS